MQTTSLYEALGGKEAIGAVVDAFYKRVVADGRLAMMFAGLDMAQQRKHLAAFLAMAFGGPSEYRGARPRGAPGAGDHDGAIRGGRGHLHATLVHFGVPVSLIETVLGAVAGLREDVVGV
ncbi:MAG: group 1 truncated hemoglobin [Chloroflexia bacterium]